MRLVIQLDGGLTTAKLIHVYTASRETLCQFPVSKNDSYFAACSSSFLGSAVAVEHIFSSGRDMISLRCSRLSAETIRVLMMAKYRLRAPRSALEEIVGDD